MIAQHMPLQRDFVPSPGFVSALVSAVVSGFVSGHDFSRAETDQSCGGFSRCGTPEAKAHFLFLEFLRHGWKPCPDTNQRPKSSSNGHQTR